MASFRFRHRSDRLKSVAKEFRNKSKIRPTENETRWIFPVNVKNKKLFPTLAPSLFSIIYRLIKFGISGFIFVQTSDKQNIKLSFVYVHTNAWSDSHSKCFLLIFRRHMRYSSIWRTSVIRNITCQVFLWNFYEQY